MLVWYIEIKGGGLSKTAKNLGYAGLALNGIVIANSYVNGKGITASQMFDFGVAAILTIATVTNPVLLVGFGVYGLLDAAGVFSDLKEGLGGDTVVLKRN